VKIHGFTIRWILIGNKRENGNYGLIFWRMVEKLLVFFVEEPKFTNVSVLLPILDTERRQRRLFFETSSCCDTPIC